MQADDVFFLLFLGYLAGVMSMMKWADAVVRKHERAKIDEMLEDAFKRRLR